MLHVPLSQKSRLPLPPKRENVRRKNTKVTYITKSTKTSPDKKEEEAEERKVSDIYSKHDTEAS